MIKTPWGYDVKAEELTDILTVGEFEVMTAGRYTGDVRTEPSIKAAQSAIRNYCGWHVYPPLPCVFDARMVDEALSRVGNDLMVQLPAVGEVDIFSVTIAGREYTDHTMEASGVLRIFDVPNLQRKDRIVVEYTAGVPEAFADGVKEIAAHRVTHALAQSYGIQSESAGGVSVNYNMTWVNNARATALPDDNKEALDPYRVMGVY